MKVELIHLQATKVISFFPTTSSNCVTETLFHPRAEEAAMNAKNSSKNMSIT